MGNYQKKNYYASIRNYDLTIVINHLIFSSSRQACGYGDGLDQFFIYIETVKLYQDEQKSTGKRL